jgi:hypothetical protein
VQLDSKPIAKGDTVYWPKATSTGEKFTAGTVVDINEFMKCVKVMFVVSVKTGKQKSEWFHVERLKWNLPEKTSTQIAPINADSNSNPGKSVKSA